MAFYRLISATVILLWITYLVSVCLYKYYLL